MSERPFVHLHCHSHYSLLDGANRLPELAARTRELGMNAIALTDHGNLYGAIEFYRECTAVGVKPIIGYEAYVAPHKRTDREARRGDKGSDENIYHHLTLLACNNTGFRNLVKMASSAFLEGYHYKPRIDKELLEAHSEGIICLSGCASAEFSDLILRDRHTEAGQVARWYERVFKDRFYIEIQDNGVEIQRLCKEGAVDIAQKLGMPLVATSDAHYLKQEDHVAHDVLLCINTGRLRTDPKRFRFESHDFHIRPPAEMYKLFPGHEDAVKRSQEIADRCDVQLDFKKRHFPVFAPPDNLKPETYLRQLCQAGVCDRYGEQPSQAVLDRLEHELGIICRMGFASYFLIVWDFVRFAGEQGIPASARGSACGALVSYVLKLSHVDPLEYDLLFERFLDPNRSEAPDIDIDFCQDRREEVIAYVRRKYGEQSVAQIATFGTMAARAAIKDVGRVMDVPLERVNRLTGMIPKVLNISIDESLQQSTDLKKEYDTDPTVRELIDIARTLEGTNRNTGTHAAGVVIANGPLTDYVPLQAIKRKGENGNGKAAEAVITTQWVMGDLEKVGLLKMDFLGLRTLTLLENCLKLIEKTRGKRIDLYREVPLDDRKTYELLQRGDARGVFQLESDGIRELLKRMKPDNIRDIIAIMALYRPGPLQGGMVDSYVNRKHGREKPTYQHPVMEEVLSETYGVLVYQEQIMRILNRLGGIELSSAYACIKAISKKKQDIIDQRRAEFIKGSKERGLNESVARDIFDLIVFFGGYGFNKSHTAAYAYVGYHTAYLKANYTPEFMAALLSSEIDDSNKREIMVEHIDDSRRLGAPVLPPDIAAGDVEFTVNDGKVLFGLSAIKGVGRGACTEIVRARQERGPFIDIYDFCERIDQKLVNRAAVEKLIKAGAFDSFGARRSQLYQALPSALEAAAELQQDRKRGQGNFFDLLNEEPNGKGRPATFLPDVEEWPSSEKLRYEKEALDFYFSSHPLAQHADDLRLAPHCTTQLAGMAAEQEVILGGMLTQIRFQTTKRASRTGLTQYARCKVEDLEGKPVECVMWTDEFARYKDEFTEDRPCFVWGTVERTREEPGLVLKKIMSLEAGKRELARGLSLQLKVGEHSPGVLDHIAPILQKARGNCPVQLIISDPIGRRAYLRLGEDYRVNPASVPLRELEAILGSGAARFVGPSGGRNGR